MTVFEKRELFKILVHAIVRFFSVDGCNFQFVSFDCCCFQFISVSSSSKVDLFHSFHHASERQHDAKNAEHFLASMQLLCDYD